MTQIVRYSLRRYICQVNLTACGDDYSLSYQERQMFTLRKNLSILWSILTSMDPAAYYALWIKVLQVICWPLDLILSVLERPFIPKGDPEPLPIVFVVGIHRTGSTLVSQVLADSFGFAPLGNFATVFPRSKYLVHLLFKRFYHPGEPAKPRKHKSFYGISSGFYTVGDSYEIWDRWLGKDHYNRPEQISGQKRKDMAGYFRALQKAWGRPIITKNNRNTLILADIYNSIPNVFFVVVNRNPADVIQSTIQASRDFFGTDEIIWGLRNDKSFDPGNYRDKLDAYCYQYLDLQDSIREELNTLPAEDYAVVQYENFCKDPVGVQKEILARIKAKYDLPGRDESFGASGYNTSRRLYDAELAEEINKRIRDIRTTQATSNAE